jgi:uncharacterized protein (TIGR02284 family)
MENAREATITILEDLINICKEENILFKTASIKITNPYLKKTLDNCAEEKDKNIHKLEREVERLGGNFNGKDLEISPQVLGNFDSYDCDKEILTRCEMMDDIVLNKYSNALNGDILWEVIPLVAKQYFASVNLHCRIMYSFKNTLPHPVYS